MGSSTRKLTIRPPKKSVVPFSRIMPTPQVGVGTGISKGSERKIARSFENKFSARAKLLKRQLQNQQQLDKHRYIQRDLELFTLVSGSIETLRDDDGNIILYADSFDPAQNVDRQDQYVSVELYSDIFDIDAAIDAVDFSIVELKSVDNRLDLLDNFLRVFRTVLPDIPDDELQFIIRRGVEEQSGEIIDPEEFDRLTDGNFSSIIQRLIDMQDASSETQEQINALESQVELLNTQLEAMGELVLETSADDSGLDLVNLIRRVTSDLRAAKLIEGEIEEAAESDGAPASITIRAYKWMGTRLGEDLSNFSNTDELQVDITFLTLLGESTTMRVSIPTEIVVPPVTTINGFREEVMGVKMRLVQTGDFKGWFKNNLKVSSATEYTTGVLVPGEVIHLKAGYDIQAQPNAGIPDSRTRPDIDDDDILLRKRRRVTIPDGDGRTPNDEDTVVAPSGNVGIGTTQEAARRRKQQSKPQGDPDVPKRPLAENEIALEELPMEEVESIVPPESPMAMVGIGSTAFVMPVVNTTPPPRKPIVVVPPVKHTPPPRPRVGVGTGARVGVGTAPVRPAPVRRTPPPRRTPTRTSTVPSKVGIGSGI